MNNHKFVIPERLYQGYGLALSAYECAGHECRVFIKKTVFPLRIVAGMTELEVRIL
jgi:hypothetical protein